MGASVFFCEECDCIACSAIPLRQAVFSCFATKNETLRCRHKQNNDVCDSRCVTKQVTPDKQTDTVTVGWTDRRHDRRTDANGRAERHKRTDINGQTSRQMDGHKMDGQTRTDGVTDGETQTDGRTQTYGRTDTNGRTDANGRRDTTNGQTHTQMDAWTYRHNRTDGLRYTNTVIHRLTELNRYRDIGLTHTQRNINSHTHTGSNRHRHIHSYIRTCIHTYTHAQMHR